MFWGGRSPIRRGSSSMRPERPRVLWLLMGPRLTGLDDYRVLQGFVVVKKSLHGCSKSV